MKLRLLKASLLLTLISFMNVANAGLIEVVTNGEFNTDAGWSSTNLSAEPLTVGVNTFDIDGAGVLTDSLAVFAKVDFNGVELYQNVSLIAGTQYFFTANVAALGGSQSNSGGGIFDLFIDGSYISGYNFGSIGVDVLETALWSTNFIATSSGNLSIKIHRSPYTSAAWTPTQYLDNVSLKYDDSSQHEDVPEPSTLAIFALGIIGLASRRFKKQS